MAVKRQVTRRPAVPKLVETVREYLLNRSMRERSDWHEKQIKTGLMEVIATAGLPDGDEGQHLRIDLPEPVEFVAYKGGKPHPTTVVAIQRQTRAGTMHLNEEKVLAFLAGLPAKRRGLYQECLATVQVVNEDAVLAANFEKRISDEELKALYDESDPTYAFQLITE
jgi:hypothetical protein